MNNNKIEVLETASKYIVNLKMGINKAVEYYQEGRENEACNLIIPITEGMEWLNNAIRLTSEIQKEPISFDVMNGKLVEVLEAFENSDYILVGDLLEYEIMPIIQRIEEIVNKTINN
ncbi:hypothetical protein [Clostridium beijerinckii]|uniref:hypothetical protein n=1 Tax=Clostridium beijerinckii TaxID=1520 RepID=UPI00047EF2FD|nr:hypothetical protein [Clostridium beijerinckii]